MSIPPKYRRKIVYHQYKNDLRDILCSYKGGEIMEEDLMTDHVHMSVEDQCIIIYGVPEGEMMFDRHAN